MDAVAKDGKLIMHYVSEHIENAGVHSLWSRHPHPSAPRSRPGDSQKNRRYHFHDRQRNQRHDSYNILFIAKNNVIKIIECNLRAARSFPFVSKVTGIDAVEMATKAMLGIPVEPYPELNPLAEYVKRQGSTAQPQPTFGERRRRQLEKWLAWEEQVQRLPQGFDLDRDNAAEEEYLVVNRKFQEEVGDAPVRGEASSSRRRLVGSNWNSGLQ